MQDDHNPYQAPSASIPHEMPASGHQGFAAPGRQVPTGNGIDWIKEGWRLFTLNPGLWIAAMLILVAISIVCSFIPFIGSIAEILLGPLFAAGIYSFAHGLASGEGADINRIFDGFREKTGPLIITGLIYFGLFLVVAFITGIFAFTFLGSTGVFSHLGGDPAQQASAFMQSDAIMGLLLTLLVFMALMIPVAAAYWFAPPLVLLAGLEPWEAMKASFSACLRNWLPFLIYGLLGTVIAFIAIIPFGLGLFVAVPLMMASMYASFQDIFGQGK